MLTGAFRFVPEPAFAARMAQMGYRDLDEEKLQAYTLFRIGIDWIRSLQSAGVTGLIQEISLPCVSSTPTRTTSTA